MAASDFSAFPEDFSKAERPVANMAELLVNERKRIWKLRNKAIKENEPEFQFNITPAKCGGPAGVKKLVDEIYDRFKTSFFFNTEPDTIRENPHWVRVTVNFEAAKKGGLFKIVF